ncbi:MAG: NHL repeat-containing protein [Anaerolineae bacterium]
MTAEAGFAGAVAEDGALGGGVLRNLLAWAVPAVGGSLPRGLADELVAEMEPVCAASAGGATHGLRAAIRAGNTLLFERNLRADPGRRVAAGLWCAVVRGGDAFVAQLGPGVCTVLHADGSERLPPEAGANGEPAGMRRDVEPAFFRASVLAGDLIVLCNEELAEELNAPDGPSSAGVGDGREILGRLHALAAGRPFRALWVQSAAEAETLPLEEPSTPEEVEMPAVEHVDVVESPVDDVDGVWMEEEADGEEQEPAQTAASRPRLTLPAWHRPDLGSVGLGFSKLANQIRYRAGMFRYGMEGFLMRVLPDKVPERPTLQVQQRHSISLAGSALIGLALALPLLVLVTVMMARAQYDRVTRAQYSQVLALAQSQYEAAESAENIAIKRNGLYEALNTIEEGLALNATDESLLAMQRRINHLLDQLNGVDRMYHFWQLVELDPELDSTSQSGRIVIDGVDVYVVNRAGAKIYHYMLNDVGDALQPVEGDPVLAESGETQSGVTLGSWVDAAWLKAGGQRSLSTFVGLDRTGTLVAYNAQQGIDALPVANSGTWLKPQAIGGYFGNLYVLDPLLSRIFKYEPTDNAYTLPPTDYVGPQMGVDLTGAVDMAIDGNLYVLFADGQVIKFFEGEVLPFSMQGLPTAMSSPTSIHVSGEQEPDAEGFVYVTDAGNQRIVQFDKTGNFIRQYQADSNQTQMDDLKAVYVDEQNKRMYILNGNTLWLADIPAMGAGSGE